MSARDYLRTLRARDAALADAIGRVGESDPTPESPILIKTIACTSYPATAKKVYCVQAVKLVVTPTEGSAPTLTAYGPKFSAVHIGVTNPPTGTVAIAEPIQGRWVFDY